MVGHGRNYPPPDTPLTAPKEAEFLEDLVLIIVIIIVISKFLERHSKAKHRATYGFMTLSSAYIELFRARVGGRRIE